jgi:hypothetical protein
MIAHDAVEASKIKEVENLSKLEMQVQIKQKMEKIECTFKQSLTI